MTTLFQDTFDRADGVPGNNWTVASGTWDISSNRLRCHTSTAVITRTVPDEAVVDLQIDVLFAAASVFASGTDFYLWWRCDATRQNCYWLSLNAGALGTAYITITRKVAGVDQQLVEMRQFATSAGAHTLTVSMFGSAMAILWDGVTVAAAYEMSIGSGDRVFMRSDTVDQTFIETFTISDNPGLNMFVVPSVVSPGSQANTLYLTGNGTAWTPGTPGDPEFTSSNAGITAQTIHTGTNATLTYNAPSTPQTVIITDPNYGRTCALVVAAGYVPPGAWGSFPPFLWDLLVARLVGIDLILAYLGYGADNVFMYRILDELGIETDQTPSEGYIKSLLASVANIEPEIMNGVEGSGTLRRAVIEALAELYTIDGFPNRVTLPDILTAIGEIEGGDLQPVLDAIEALATQLTTAQTSLNIIGGNDTETIAMARADVADVIIGQGVTDANVAAVQADLDAVRTGSDYTLGTVGNWILGLGGVQALTLAAVLASVLGRGTVTALQVVDVVTDVVAAGTDLEDIVTVILSWLGNMAAPTLPTISVDLGGIVNDITAVHDDLALDTQTILDAVDGVKLDLSSEIAGLDAKLDQILQGMGAASGSPPAWPGLDAVTLGPSVPITQDMTIDGPLDGILWEVTGFSEPPPSYAIGDRTSFSKLGIASFISDNADAERFQTVSFDAGILIPTAIIRPAYCVVHWRVGVSGTVTPWTVD